MYVAGGRGRGSGSRVAAGSQYEPQYCLKASMMLNLKNNIFYVVKVSKVKQRQKYKKHIGGI